MSNITEFWDSIYSNSTYSRRPELAVVEAAENHFAQLRGRSVMEIGCGPGASTFYFASRGAEVIGVDISAKAIDDMNDFCNSNGIKNVRGICANVLDLSKVEPVDFVFGSMILHHIEPFDSFVEELRRILKPGGKAFFYENSAASRTLVWFRQNVVGNWWVPKHGDPDEFPLTPQEVDKLRRTFRVEVQYPEMLFFRLISIYLLRGAFSRFFTWLDQMFYRRKWLLRYSYRQFLLIYA
jgi:SAM-dependent methyltransferase